MAASSELAGGGGRGRAAMAAAVAMLGAVNHRAAMFAAAMIVGAMIAGAMIGTAMPARAATPSPVCSDPDVLDWVRQNLREREPYATMQSRTVNEAPGGLGDVVRCSVCVQPFVYDPGRRQMVPVLRCESHGFVVRTLPSGFLILSVD